MNAIEKFVNRNGIFIILGIWIMFFGSYIGRTDIVDSCNDLGTFTQYGTTYTCGVAE